MQLSNDVSSGVAVRDRVHDDDVRNALYHSGFQLLPPPDRDGGVLRAQNNCEVLLELTGEESYDFHMLPGRMS